MSLLSGPPIQVSEELGGVEVWLLPYPVPVPADPCPSDAGLLWAGTTMHLCNVPQWLRLWDRSCLHPLCCRHAEVSVGGGAREVTLKWERDWLDLALNESWATSG